MWPLYLLLNKILRPEEGGEEVGRECVDGSLVGEELDLLQLVPYEKFPTVRKCHASVRPRSQFIDVPHVNQLSSWDCGLACVLMVLRTMGIGNCNIDTLAELCSTKSIWTVDLAYLLKKFSVNFCYYTITVGANPNYSDETFYKEQLSTDVVRVEKLFREALASGICIQCRSISEEEISLLILSGKYVAIALVDQFKLSSRTWLQDVCLSSLGSSNAGYTGHYVVICGYDADKDEFKIRDPASSLYSLPQSLSLSTCCNAKLYLDCVIRRELKKKIFITVFKLWGCGLILCRKHEKVSSKCLGEARKSFGTDEDLLLISLGDGGNVIGSSALPIPSLVNINPLMPSQ